MNLTCMLCGASLHRVPHESWDEWAWADESGMTIGHCLPMPVPELLDLVLKAQPTGELYSSLLARYQLGLICDVHDHKPDPSKVPAVTGIDIPWHCNQPMRLLPSGWKCGGINGCGHSEEASTEIEALLGVA